MESTLAESIRQLLACFPPEYFSLGDTITGDKAKPGNRAGTCQESPAAQDWPGKPRPGVDIVMHPLCWVGYASKQAVPRHNRLKQTEGRACRQGKSNSWAHQRSSAEHCYVALCDTVQSAKVHLPGRRWSWWLLDGFSGF